MVTHYRQRCRIAHELFPGRYGEWADSSLSDEELNAVDGEMSRWSATAAQQRLDFSSTLSSTVNMPDSNCAVPGDAAPPLQPAATILERAEASEGSLAQAEAAEEHSIPDQEDDEEQVRDKISYTSLVMLYRLQTLYTPVPECTLRVTYSCVQANGACTPLTLTKA